MKEDYKFLLILGNGFDLDLGLKTKYTDFMKSAYFQFHLLKILYHPREI